jgi:hypothetical protein
MSMVFRLNTRKSLRSKAMFTSTAKDLVALSGVHISHTGHSNVHGQDSVTILADDMHTYDVHGKVGV